MYHSIRKLTEHRFEGLGGVAVEAVALLLAASIAATAGAAGQLLQVPLLYM